MDIAVLTCVAVAVIELVLAVSWAGFYYRYGIPLYRRTLQCGPDEDGLPGPEKLSEKYSSRLLPPFTFHALGPGELAFREWIIQLSLIMYSPIMHGHIAYDEGSGTLTLTGYANAWPLCFLGVVILMTFRTLSSSPRSLIFPGLVLLIFGICYGLQILRFNKLYAALQQELEKAA